MATTLTTWSTFCSTPALSRVNIDTPKRRHVRNPSETTVRCRWCPNTDRGTESQGPIPEFLRKFGILGQLAIKFATARSNAGGIGRRGRGATPSAEFPTARRPTKTIREFFTKRTRFSRLRKRLSKVVIVVEAVLSIKWTISWWIEPGRIVAVDE
ncbi:hypothetical protein WA026_009528 [Henosepilachna vigintioctopunctata]|uniref:Uncharacterized protein n=1 Tax=Henosepilachna vigintioctopunctata TaxID=420089 RepID=A0AAW1U454_9CUCU